MANRQSAHEAKAALRALVRAGRARRSEAEHVASAELLAASVLDFLPADVTDVTCYISLPTEPGTGPIIAGLLERGCQPWLPRIRGRELEWVRIDDATAYERGPLGISEPIGPADSTPRVAQLLLMPATAVDATGRRLGQGGGYYDRALVPLATHAAGGPLLVALVFDDEVVDEVPADQHDRRVDIMITPRRTLIATPA